MMGLAINFYGATIQQFQHSTIIQPFSLILEPCLSIDYLKELFNE